MQGFPNIGEDFGGRYHLERELGRGGMGVVYAARDTTLQRQVALKILHPMLATDDEYRERFAREAATLARMDSPMIVQIFDYGERDGSLFLVTQLVTQGDLHAWLRAHGPLDTDTALSVTHDLCEALADAHQAGVVHRDVKPSNVFLRTRGGRLSALLGDFGIATSEDAHVTKTGTVVGSTAYMAPERHRGARADERADIYSVGCVLWMALTGHAPYNGTDMQVAMAHMSDPVPQLTDGRPQQAAINEILGRSMAKDPYGRYTTVADLAQAVADVQRASRPEPEPTTGPGTVFRPAVTPPPTPTPTPAPTPTPTPAPSPTPPPVRSDAPSGRHTPVRLPGLTGPTEQSPADQGLDVGHTVLRPQEVAVGAPPSHKPPLLWVIGGVVALVALLGGTFVVLHDNGGSNPTTSAAFKTKLYDGLARTDDGWRLGESGAHCVGDKYVAAFGEDRLTGLGIVDKTGLVELDPRLGRTDADAYADAWVSCGLTAQWAWDGYLRAKGKQLNSTAAEQCVQNALSARERRAWIASYLTNTNPLGTDHSAAIIKDCVTRATS